MRGILLILALVALSGCNDSVRWNEEAQRCQQVNEPYQFVPSSACGR